MKETKIRPKMSDFSLACYTIRVNRKKTTDSRKKPDSMQLGSTEGKFDLFGFLKDFLDDVRTNPRRDQNDCVLMKVTEHKVDPQKQEIVGIIEGGKYGLSSNLVDSKTFQTVHARERDQAELLPFYFFLLIPENADEAILMLGRIGKKGIRKDLAKFILIPFEEKFKDYDLKISPLITDAIIEQYLTTGNIQSLRFVKFQIPHDLVDALEDGHTEIPISREIIYQVKDRSQRLPIKKEVFTNFFRKPKVERKVTELFELRESESGYDTIKVEVDIGGSVKTINLDNFGRVRNYFDISKDPALLFSGDGHPTFDSINDIAHTLCKKMLEIMYR
jgi:hypothetical protein